MQPPQNDEGVTHFQRLDPGRVDVVLGSHRSRVPPRKRSGSKAVWVAGLTLLGLFAYITAGHLRAPAPTTAPLPDITQAPTATEAGEAPAPIAAAVAPVRVSVATTPRATPQPVPAKPQSLDNCLGDGTAIDAEVAKCRFGTEPKSAPAAGLSQGMVSSRYMAQYKAEQARPVSYSGKPYEVATVEIREWKGRNRYRAQWKIVDNEIDNDSVCANFPGNSIEHRECRLAAVVYFKEACQEWSKRAGHENDQQTLAAKQRYCLATKTFAAQD